MHDTDRILAELEALDSPTHESELEDEGVLQEYEDLENLEEMEFQPEANFGSYETSFGGPGQYEAEGEAEGEGELEDEGEYEGEGEGEYEGVYGSMLGEQEGEGEAEGEGEYEDEYQGEYASGVSGELAGETVGGINELQEMELAAELLETQGEEELEHFLGGFLSKTLGKAVQTLAGPAGDKLRSLLKDAAQKLIPVAGTALGTAFGGPAGAAIGGNIAAKAQQLFGLELEGLALEDQEFEAARSFVRFATDAARQFANAQSDDPAAAHHAIMSAAQRWAPGLLATSGTGLSMPFVRRRRRRMTGRWIRVARNQIVLYGL